MTADITIYKKNNLYLFIDTPLDINREIYDLFSFFLKGYEFMPSYKYGTFDGKKHLYDINRHELPIGLLSDLLKFAQKNSYSVKLEDKTEILPINYNNEIDEFMSKIQTYTNKSLSGVYEFQRIAVERALRKQRQLLLSPTSSGKSNIIYLIVRFLLEYTDLKILLLVPSTGLVEQMVSDFASYVNDGYDIESQCHKIYGGKEKGTDKRITVSTWQSLHMIGDLDKNGNQLGLPFDLSYFNHDVLICDEVHTATGDSILKIIDKLQDNSKIRLGFTGSLDDSKIMLMQLKACFGSVHVTTTSRELQDSGVQSELSIEINLLKYTNETLELFNKTKKTYPQEIKWLITNKDRNDFIINRALGLTNNTLILFHNISHGKALKKELEIYAERYNKKILYIAGEIKTDKREEIRQEIELSDNLILLASFGTFKQGINAPNLHTVIFAHPFESTITNIQSIGRGLRRIAGKKEKIKLIDIGDDLRYAKKSGSAVKQNYALKHLYSRISIYEKEQFDYKTKKVVL